MERLYVEDKKFEKTDLAGQPLQVGDYENCIFSYCEFSKAVLSGLRFVDCTFSNCNMSMALLGKTSFKDVQFMSCKLLGLHFEDCDDFLFSVAFDSCTLDFASFRDMKLKNTLFKNSSLQEADFSGADLTNAQFDDCNLDRAVFAHSKLEGTDFRTAYNYSIDPELNQVKKAMFSLAGVGGLLEKYGIEIFD